MTFNNLPVFRQFNVVRITGLPTMARNAIFAGLILCSLFLACQTASGAETRAIADIERSIAALLYSPAEDAFLIIGIAGTGDFVQMSAHEGTAELDFPQITPRQKEIRPTVEKVCSDLGLELTINIGSDGSEFLDYELPQGAAKSAEMVRQILIRVYDANANTALEFEANGFDLPEL